MVVASSDWPDHFGVLLQMAARFRSGCVDSLEHLETVDQVNSHRKKVAPSVPTQLNGEWPADCCQILHAGRPQRASASRDGEYGPFFESIVDDVQSGVS